MDEMQCDKASVHAYGSGSRQNGSSPSVFMFAAVGGDGLWLAVAWVVQVYAFLGPQVLPRYLQLCRETRKHSLGF